GLGEFLRTSPHRDSTGRILRNLSVELTSPSNGRIATLLIGRPNGDVSHRIMITFDGAAAKDAYFEIMEPLIPTFRFAFVQRVAAFCLWIGIVVATLLGGFVAGRLRNGPDTWWSSALSFGSSYFNHPANDTFGPFFERAILPVATFVIA